MQKPQKLIAGEIAFFLGSSGNLVASFRHQIELSAVEQNSQAVVLEISKSPGGGLDGLDPAVESFCSCVSYSMPEITE